MIFDLGWKMNFLWLKWVQMSPLGSQGGYGSIKVREHLVIDSGQDILGKIKPQQTRPEG